MYATRNKISVIENSDEMESIVNCIVNLFNESTVKLISNNFICDEYYYEKSHRSNTTEGNTTSRGEFTDLVKNWKQGNQEYVVVNKPYDESYEISNLTMAFRYLETADKVNLVQFQNATEY